MEKVRQVSASRKEQSQVLYPDPLVTNLTLFSLCQSLGLDEDENQPIFQQVSDSYHEKANG